MFLKKKYSLIKLTFYIIIIIFSNYKSLYFLKNMLNYK